MGYKKRRYRYWFTIVLYYRKISSSKKQEWLHGVVNQLNPTKVIVNGWKTAYEWNHIKHIREPVNTPTNTHMLEKVTETKTFTQTNFISPANSRKINTKSYERILRHHFRETSSSSIYFNLTPKQPSRSQGSNNVS